MTRGQQASPSPRVEGEPPRPSIQDGAAAGSPWDGRGGSFKAGRSRRSRAPFLLLATSLVAAAALLPSVFLLRQVATGSTSELVALLLRRRVLELLVNTMSLVVVVTSASVVIGAVAAWLTERTSLPGAAGWRVLLVLPIAVPEFVNCYAWLSVSPAVHGLWGASLVSILSLYPLVYLPAAATLRVHGSEQEEVARSLGASPVAVAVRVVLPQLRPALIGGAVLVSLHLLGEYGAFALLRFPTFAVAIFTQYKLGFDAAGAAGLSLVLVLLCLLVLAGQHHTGRQPVRYGATVGPAAPARPLGRAAPWCVGGLAVLCLLALAVPVGGTTSWLVRGSSTTLPPASAGVALLNTMLLGGVAALLSTVAAVPIAVLAVRSRGRMTTLIEAAPFLNRALPGVVVGLALVSVALHGAGVLYQSSILLVFAYCALFLPLAVVAVKAGLAQIPAAVPEVARGLGAGPLGAWLRVLLPLLWPALGSAAALVLLSSVTELTATLLLHPTGVQTLATQFWVYTTGQAYGAAAPYVALMLLVSVGPTYLLTRRLDPYTRRAPAG